MNNTKWLGLAAVLAFAALRAPAQTAEAPAPGAPAQAQPAAPVNLSPGAAEVVRLAGSGVGDDVVLAYIQNSQAPFTLAADDVLYLKDIGVSPQVTSAMLNHDSGLHNPGQQYAPSASAPPAPPANAPLTHDWQVQSPPPAPAPAAPQPSAAPPPPNMAPPPANAAPPPAYVTSAPPDVNYFYNDLAPYGSWVSLEGYGWCWQPRAVVMAHGWRPYCDGGHWVYTDAGWFWQSDYSWGWAPFHYGRWYMHPSCGWVWTPDRVWGPAWVTWRADGGTCGWAPLPPHAEFDLRLGWRFNGVAVGASFGFGLGVNAFAFVSFGNFCDHNLAPHCLPPSRATVVYKQTTVVNNYVVVNNTVVHRGIPLERVSAASHVPVPRATVHELPAGAGKIAHSSAVVYREPLHAPARPVNMVAQKVDAGHPAIQHAPIVPARTTSASSFSRTGSAPGAASRTTGTQGTRTSTWSSGAKPSTSQGYSAAPGTRQSTSAPGTSQGSAWSNNTKPAYTSQSQATTRTYNSAASSSAATTTARPLDEWKQGSRTAANSQSEAALAANSKPHTAGQTPLMTTRSSDAGNTHVYEPKSSQQAAEIRQLPKSDQNQSGSSSSPASKSDGHSQKDKR